MLDLNFAFFILFFILGLCSVLGYGYIFQKLILKKYNFINYQIYNGFYGLGLLSLLSMITSIIVSHNYIHNIIIHLIGLASFIFFFKGNFKYFLNILKITSVVFILLLIFKTNEDFPYYHLPFTNYLVENKIIFGMGNINHGYNYISSLFFLNSTFYLPSIDFNSFHFSILYFLIFFNYFILVEIFLKKNNPVIYFLYLFAFTFFNVSFNRIAEYGTDKPGQLLIIIIIIKLIDILCFRKKNKLDDILYLVPLLAICITLKTYFLPYILLSIPVLFIKKKPLENLIKLIFTKSFIFFIFMVLFNFLHHFISTGCIISPIYYTCFGDKISWGRSIDEVKGLSIWLEQWSKAGAGPNFRIEDPLEYIKFFNWIPNWFEKYFITKFLDQLLILITSYTLIFIIFKKFTINKIRYNFNKKIFFLIYIVVVLIFFIWLNKHPALRYGGYPVIFLILSMPIAYLFNIFEDKKFLKIRLKTFVIFIFLIINIKNSMRIYTEFFKDNNYKKNSFPHYALEEPNYVKKKFLKDFYIYSTMDRFCWKIPSPCGNSNNVYVSKKYGYFYINRIKKD